MNYAHAADAYRRTQVQSGTPLELVVMLYDGALRFLSQAQEAVDRRDIRSRHAALDKALAIVGHLQTTLDTDRGGAVAVELDRLYRYISERLLDCAAHNDPAALQEAARLLTHLRDAWHTVATAPPPAAAAARELAEARP